MKETPVRTKEPAGRGMTVDPRAVRKEVAFVLIHFCGEWCPGRDGAACEPERGDLPFDDDVITEMHAAIPALPAIKRHGKQGWTGCAGGARNIPLFSIFAQ
jgi:hypothetical protein